MIVNVLFKTQRKIAGLKDGVVIYGSDDPTQWQEHKWRFETYTPNIDWIITDIDDYLKGNPYQWKYLLLITQIKLLHWSEIFLIYSSEYEVWVNTDF